MTTQDTPTPLTDALIARWYEYDATTMPLTQRTKIDQALSHARSLERSLAAAQAENEAFRRALQRIAITDDEDCAHVDEAKVMTRIASRALAPQEGERDD